MNKEEAIQKYINHLIKVCPQLTELALLKYKEALTVTRLKILNLGLCSNMFFLTENSSQFYSYLSFFALAMDILISQIYAAGVIKE